MPVMFMTVCNIPARIQYNEYLHLHYVLSIKHDCEYLLPRHGNNYGEEYLHFLYSLTNMTVSIFSPRHSNSSFPVIITHKIMTLYVQSTLP